MTCSTEKSTGEGQERWGLAPFHSWGAVCTPCRVPHRARQGTRGPLLAHRFTCCDTGFVKAGGSGTDTEIRGSCSDLISLRQEGVLSLTGPMQLQ